MLNLVAALIGYGLIELGQVRAARLIFRWLNARDPSEPYYCNMLTYAEGRLGNSAVAKGLSEGQLAANPDDTDALIFRIEQLVKEGNLAGASRDLRHVLPLLPAEHPARASLVNLLHLVQAPTTETHLRHQLQPS